MKKLFVSWIVLLVLLISMLIIEGTKTYDLPDGLLIAAIAAETIVFLCLIVKFTRMFK